MHARIVALAQVLFIFLIAYLSILNLVVLTSMRIGLNILVE